MNENKKLIFTSNGKYYVISENKPEVFLSPESCVDYILDNTKNIYYILAQPQSNLIIRTLYKLFNSGDCSEVYICKASFLNYKNISDPLTFNKLWSVIIDSKIPPSIGGPRLISYDDFLFGTIQEITQTAPITDTFLLMQDHSMWMPGNFFTITSPEAFGRTLGFIGDPRWFIQPDTQGNRYQKLYEKLGLFKENFIYYITEDPTLTTPECCCLASWYSSALCTEAFNNININDPDIAPKSSLIGTRPGDYFLRKLFREEARTGNGLRSLLRTTKAFIRIISDIWIYIKADKSIRDNLFIPEYVFDTKTAKAFREYINPLLN